MMQIQLCLSSHLLPINGDLWLLLTFSPEKFSEVHGGLQSSLFSLFYDF